jgi:hypothetical protein
MTAARRQDQRRHRGATRYQNAAALTVRHQVRSSRLFQAGAGIRLMLACRRIGPERVCSGPQLINVNATAEAKFVDSAKSVAVSSIFADDQHACGINRQRSSGDSAI